MICLAYRLLGSALRRSRHGQGRPWCKNHLTEVSACCRRWRPIALMLTTSCPELLLDHLPIETSLLSKQVQGSPLQQLLLCSDATVTTDALLQVMTSTQIIEFTLAPRLYVMISRLSCSSCNDAAPSCQDESLTAMKTLSQALLQVGDHNRVHGDLMYSDR